MSKTEVDNDVVQSLLQLREGDRVHLEAANYEWASPFAVDEIDEQSWLAPTGAVWRSRRVRLTPESDHPTASDREIDVYEDGPAPAAGAGYGSYTAVFVENEVEDISVDGVDGDQDDDDDQDEEDDVDIDLPDGVTVDDIDELTSGRIEIGDLADELGVHRNQARTIAHELGYYKRVREVWRDRERAQVDPRALGILVLVVGLLFTGAISIGVVL